MLKKYLLLFLIFIYCGNSEARETISSEQNIGGINNISLETSSLDSTTTTIFSSSPVSSVLKISKTSETTTTTVPQTTTTTTVPETTTTTTVPETTTTTTVPQTTTTTTVPQTTTTTTTTVPQTTTIGVTVANNGQVFNEYFLNGTNGLTLNVTIGNKYRFDLSDTSNAGHPLRFSETQNGSQYSSNVTTNGVAGTPGAYIEIEITSNTPNQLYIYCENHFGMGGDTKILTP